MSNINRLVSEAVSMGVYNKVSPTFAGIKGLGVGGALGAGAAMAHSAHQAATTGELTSAEDQKKKIMAGAALGAGVGAGVGYAGGKVHNALINRDINNDNKSQGNK